MAQGLPTADSGSREGSPPHHRQQLQQRLHSAMPSRQCASSWAASGQQQQQQQQQQEGEVGGCPACSIRSVDLEARGGHQRLHDSLRHPERHPSCWGQQYRHLQARLAHALESSAAHFTVIGLTALDLSIVVTELALSSVYCSYETLPHAVHVAEEVLSWTSVGILGLFMAELLAKLCVFGPAYYTRSRWHLLDAAIVVVSLALELSLQGVAKEVASLLVFFRLWRIMRVVHGVAEAMELNHEQQLHRHHELLVQARHQLASERQRTAQLERELAALQAAAAAQGLDVPSTLQGTPSAMSPGKDV